MASAQFHESKFHSKARQQYPGYPERFVVSDAFVRWDIPFPSYNPPDFTSPQILSKKASPSGVDPADVKQVDFSTRITFENGGLLLFDASTRRPINPAGRTGLCGRGRLYKWGPNHAADPIVSRVNEQSQAMEIVVIQRSDLGNWALPGGMVDFNEKHQDACQREFAEEACANSFGSNTTAQQQRDVLKRVFADNNRVSMWCQYVDDPRNTDNAWIETCAFHYHINWMLSNELKLKAGDDAVNVRWLPLTQQQNLHANHQQLVDHAVELFKKAKI